MYNIYLIRDCMGFIKSHNLECFVGFSSKEWFEKWEMEDLFLKNDKCRNKNIVSEIKKYIW